ncbi:Protein PELOTA 1 [Vitis vinifera]|uniref:Protein PELOTA 1 n=1 Tax=Vitis vinifera TaxID=29760 RepID=A0A438EK00_VITVI|nr:Protein PELOTA 1 [Vitis vinifera]
MKLVEEEKSFLIAVEFINIVPEELDDMWLLYNLISKAMLSNPRRRQNLVHNEHVDAGAFHTIEIERNKPFDLKKKAWDSDAIEELRSYGNAAKADLAVLLIQDVSAELYSIGKIATTLCANIEAPSKTNRAAKSKSQSKSNKFF